LAKLLGRSPSSVARKLGNFASFDPSLQARGIKGLTNASKLDREIWNEFYQDWDSLFLESEKELAKRQHTTLEKLYRFEEGTSLVGEDEVRSVKVRLNQSIFRKIVLANYDNQCCITGIDKTELLVAGHIVPWSEDQHNRLNPKNGLLLNALHDRAFKNGLITVDEEYKIRVSSVMKRREKVKSIVDNFLQYEGKSILLPKKFLPDPKFLRAHNERFKA
jgi:putative restriction endonuclease